MRLNQILVFVFVIVVACDAEGLHRFQDERGNWFAARTGADLDSGMFDTGGSGTGPTEETAAADTGGIVLSSAPSSVTWIYRGPGGMGAFPAVSRAFVTNEAMAGADVGGSFHTSNNGGSWTSGPWLTMSGGTYFENPLEVHDLMWRRDSEGNRTAYMASAEGPYRSTDLVTWELLNVCPPTTSTSDDDAVCTAPGTCMDCAGTTTAAASNANEYGDRFQYSVQSVAVDPFDPDVVWFGMGRAVSPDISFLDDRGTSSTTDDLSREKTRHHPHKVYRSTDGGITMKAVLDIDDATVFAITIGRDDPDRVWVATNRGLFHTMNGSASSPRWYEVGVPVVKTTVGTGNGDPDTWSDCTGNLSCDSSYQSDPDCTLLVDCLPVVSSAELLDGSTITGESHPNLRDIDAVGAAGAGAPVLWVAAWDRGFYGGSGSGCVGAGRWNDSGLTKFKGGVYASTDYGLTWEWRFKTSAANFSKISYRCTDLTSEYGATNASEVEGTNSASYPEHLVGMWGSGGGIYEQTALSATYQYKSEPPTSQGGSATGTAVWELPLGGNAKQNHGYDIYQSWPWMIDFVYSYPRGKGYLTHYRGVHLAQPTNDVWTLRNKALDTYSALTTPATWSGSGLDDTCALGLANMRVSGTDYLFLGAADGGVFRSTNSGQEWMRMSTEINAMWSDDWDSLLGSGIANGGEEVYDVLVDGSTLYVTVSSRSGSANLQTVLQSTNQGQQWQLIGGDTTTSTNFGSLDIDKGEIVDLELGAGSGATRELFAGTSERGLWHYKPGRTPLWRRVGTSDGCPDPYVSAALRTNQVRSVITDPTGGSIGYVYAAFNADADVSSSSNSGDTEDGIWKINTTLSGSTACQRVQVTDGADCDTEGVCDPSAVTVAMYSGVRYIVAASQQDYSLRYHATVSDTSAWSGTVFDTRSTLDTAHPDYYYQLQYPWYRRVSALTTHPQDLHVVIAAFQGSPSGDGYNPTQVLSSDNAGQTWSRDANLAGNLPSLNLRGFKIVQEGGSTGDYYMYALGNCTSVYRAPDPW